MSITTSARDALAEFRGTLIEPGDAGYDEARAVYNGMIDRRPALIAQCAGADDVARIIGYAREAGLPLAVRGGGHNGAGLGTIDDGVVLDLSAMRGIDVDPARPHRPRRRRLHVGRGRPGHPRARAREPERHHRHDRRRRAHARRRPRPPDPEARAGDRQPAVGRRRARERRARACEQGRAPGPVLGAARRRRQLRRRDRVRVPPPRGEHGDRRPDVLAGRAGRRGAVGVPRVPPRRPARSQRLLRLRDGAARGPVPAGDPPARGVRRGLVPHGRRGGRGARHAAAARRAARAAAARRPADAVPDAAERVRRAVPEGRPVVLARGLRQGHPGRGRRDPPAVGRAAAVDEVDDAPVPDRRRGARRGVGGHRVELPRCALGHGLRGRGPGPGQRREDRRLVARLPGGAPPVLRGRRVREHDDGRGARPRPRELPRQLRPAHVREGPVRPRQRVLEHAEHPPGEARPAEPARHRRRVESVPSAGWRPSSTCRKASSRRSCSPTATCARRSCRAPG